MKDQNRNASQRLSNRLERTSWEFVLLMILLVTVLGVALRSPMKSFPDLASSHSMNQLERDPYDLASERPTGDNRNRLETGL